MCIYTPHDPYNTSRLRMAEVSRWYSAEMPSAFAAGVKGRTTRDTMTKINLFKPNMAVSIDLYGCLTGFYRGH